MLPAAGGYTKPTNPAVLSHDYFPAEVLSETPTDKPVRWEGLPYIFTCGCCQQAEILISYTANLAGFTETLPKRNPELQSRRFVSHCQAEDNRTQHLAPTYFQTASRSIRIPSKGQQLQCVMRNVLLWRHNVVTVIHFPCPEQAVHCSH